MPTKPSESAAAARKSGVEPRPGVAALHVPRGWLVLLATLLVLPWLVVAAYVWGRPAATTAAEPLPRPIAESPGASGPWGALRRTPILVSPPLEYVATDFGSRPPLEWSFPEASADLVGAFLNSTGMSADDVAALRARSRQEPAIKGIVIAPEAALIRRLTPQVREKLYVQLAKSRLNLRQRDAFRFQAPLRDAWLASSSLSAATRALVEPLLYQHGAFWFFADLDVIRPEVSDPAELRRLMKVLVRQTAWLVELSVEDGDDVQALAEYWGRGGRRLDIRPLLESVAGTDRSIDIAHLLPAFARNHLYRYPRIQTADYLKPLLANCLWSALNFFAIGTPDDRYLDLETAMSALRNDYYLVEDNFQLGDIIGFVDKDETLFHVAVYLADGLAFTKNGTSPLSPWTVMPVDDIKGFYQTRAPSPRLVYHRRKDF